MVTQAEVGVAGSTEKGNAFIADPVKIDGGGAEGGNRAGCGET